MFVTMDQKDQIAAEIDRIVQSHYYDEDFQLMSSLQAFAAGLSDAGRETLAGVAFARLTGDGSLVDVLLCSVVDVPSAVPVLAAKLGRETQTNQVTRTLISVLSRYPSDDAYMAIEPFLDSDQEMESLQALARIDFIRTLPAIVRRMKKDHYAGAVLQMFQERIKKAGLPKLIDELRQSSATRFAGFPALLAKILRSKDASYNPLSARELEALIEAFNGTS